MTKIAEIVSKGTCALCGKGVHIDTHEGRVACNGCNMATDNCTCAPLRRGAPPELALGASCAATGAGVHIALV